VSRVPVKPQDFEVGRPLRWDIYDQQGNLVLAKGAVLGSEQEKDELLKRRRVRELDLRLDVPSADDEDDSTESRREVRILLDETRIQPGEAMQIQSSLDSTRFAVRLIGYQKGKSIIVTNPLVDGAPVYLKDGQAFIARIFSGKYVYAFPCNVLASGIRPYAYVHLSYPVDVVGVNIRKSDRVRLRAITAFDTDDDRQGAGAIVDLSCGGALLVSKSLDIALGRRLLLKFKVAIGSIEYVLQLPGYVRSLRAYDEEPSLGSGYGVEFTDISPEDNLVLSSFIFQQIAENRVS